MTQDAEPDPSIRPCYFETFAKGTYADGTVFKADVSQPFRDVDIEVNRTLLPQTLVPCVFIGLSCVFVQ